MATAAAFALCAAMLGACSSAPYDTGDGKYSYLTADFAEAATDASCHVTALTTDNGTTWHVNGTLAPQWATTPDSTYRVIAYYDAPGATAAAVSVRSIAQVPTLVPADASTFKKPLTDPVRLESAWTSANRRYVNISLLLMTGQPDDPGSRQVIGMMAGDTTADAGGKRTLHLTLYHDQGGVPQKYSARQYASIPTAGIDADSVSITVNTYDGTLTRTLAIK